MRTYDSGTAFIQRQRFSAEGKAGTWVSDAKSQSGSTLKKMAADENAVLIFGSSELRHGQGSGFHGDTIFDGADMDPIYVGKAGYQSLTHAITLGAVGSQAANKKAVLIVSPQWFKENGVKSTAFEAAFSEEEYIALLENPDISQETKDYINGRLQNIMADNETMSEKVKKPGNGISRRMIIQQNNQAGWSRKKQIFIRYCWKKRIIIK